MRTWGGIDCAERHHDVAITQEAGKISARRGPKGADARLAA